MPQTNLHFSISERKLYLRILDILFSISGLYLINFFFNFEYFSFSSPKILNWILLLILYLNFFGEIFEMYNLKVSSDRYLTFKSLIITVVFTVILYFFTPILSPVLPQNRMQLVYFSMAILISIFINRLLYIQFIFSPRFLKNILVIAETDEIENVLNLNQNKEVNKITTYVSNNEFTTDESLTFIDYKEANLEQIIKEKYISEILVSSNSSKFFTKKINNQLINLFEKGFIINSIDSFIESETFRISKNQLNQNFYNYFTFSKSHQNSLYLVFRRVLDILIALIGIVFFIGIIPIIFLGNIIGNRGALIYTQKRVGRRGAEFTIIKFRSMVPNAEKNGVEWSKKGDVRITPFGKFLRKTRIDEIPQFINVFKGEMSLIGPRPERPEFVLKLEKEIPYYAIRHVIKPGLSGWAQVMHPYASSVDDQEKKLMYDLYYIKERNFILDLKITIKTFSTVLFFRGT
jgi:exopolysaccharide biosynthesis polyprenyl glycosylphosphotransferase